MKAMSIERYGALDRLNHWVTAMLFVMLALSGMALFHPSLFWLSQFFGGGTWMRILHPFLGVIFFLSFMGLVWRFFLHNLISATDLQWLRQIGDVVLNREDRLPQVDRYNAGQKLLFWSLLLLVPLLLVSGVVIWRPWFAPWFSMDLLRLAALLHSLAAFIIIVAITVHIYAAFWVSGTMGAMIRGRVSGRWAARHHAAWYARILRGDDH